jgi:hypothetical protein
MGDRRPSVLILSNPSLSICSPTITVISVTVVPTVSEFIIIKPLPTTLPNMPQDSSPCPIPYVLHHFPFVRNCSSAFPKLSRSPPFPRAFPNLPFLLSFSLPFTRTNFLPGKSHQLLQRLLLNRGCHLSMSSQALIVPIYLTSVGLPMFLRVALCGLDACSRVDE